MADYAYIKLSAADQARLAPSDPGPDDEACDCGGASADCPDRDDTHDPVSRPAHYLFDDGVEVIALTEQLNFNCGNIVKYAARAGRKGTPADAIQDIDKAIWYAQRERARLQRRAF
jgi:hypothetical protein